MHGPHGTSALFAPHPVERNDTLYLQVSLYAKCHGETADKCTTAKEGSLPICLECHAAAVERTVSQGINMVPNMLVSFEEPVKTRSHEISRSALNLESSLLPIAMQYLSDAIDEVEVEITNNLPHKLPTWTFGQKSIQLVIQFLKGKQKNGLAHLTIPAHR